MNLPFIWLSLRLVSFVRKTEQNIINAITANGDAKANDCRAMQCMQECKCMGTADDDGFPPKCESLWCHWRQMARDHVTFEVKVSCRRSRGLYNPQSHSPFSHVHTVLNYGKYNFFLITVNLTLTRQYLWTQRLSSFQVIQKIEILTGL